MYVIDLAGNEYALQATSTNEGETNGNQSFSATILPTKVNKLFIDKIDRLWTVVDLDGVEHKIIHLRKKGEGETLTVEVKGIPLFFDTLDNDRIYERYDEHMTPQLAFTRIFDNTGFTFVLNGQFAAVQWEGFGDGETKLESFQRALERYKCEFRIVGNIVYLEKQIGNDTNHQYRHHLNASNIVQEIDASEMWTFARGYGNYGDGGGGEDWQDAKLIREYTSPLAQILGIRHAPPIKNGNITTETQMDAQLKILVDESLKISVTADVRDLRKQNYPIAQSELGDRAFLTDERIGLDDEVRIVHRIITRNWRGDVLDVNYTFGTQNIVKRHQSKLNTAIKEITALLEGKRQLPYSVYDEAIKNAVTSIKNARTELTFPDEGGIWGIDKDNPNYVTGMTSRGFMVSTDGGATPKAAITGEGVIAETIIGQNIIGVNLSSIDESGYFHVTGSDAEFYDTSTGRRVSIRPNGIYGYNANNSVRFQADSSLVTSAALGTSNLNVYLAAGDSDLLGEVRAVRRDTIPGGGDPSDYTYINVRMRAMKSPPNANAYVGTDGEFRIMSEGLITSGVYRNARMNKAFTNGVEVNGGDILYLRSDNRVRIMRKGDSGAYSDLQLAHIQAQSIRKNTEMSGTHLYIGSGDGETRFTSNGLADGVYRRVRAQGYLLPDGSEAFSGLSSRINNRPEEGEAIDLIRNTDLMRYTTDEEPAYKIVDTRKSIDDKLGDLIKAVQEIIEKVGA